LNISNISAPTTPNAIPSITSAIKKLNDETDNVLNTGLDQLMEMVKSIDAILLHTAERRKLNYN
jgi:hypothetical protein